ncbi:MAG: hypothetical protein J5789_04705 [Oscillospiraceae bacterium]|nr:hypothetical protein [Oscillospiraceae bacterium]
MKKGFASYVRIIGTIYAVLNFISAFIALGSSFFVFLVNFTSAVLVLIYAFHYANHIEITLDHEEDIMAISERLKTLEAVLRQNQADSQAESAADMEGTDRSEHEGPVLEAGQAAVKPIPDPDDPNRITCPHCGEVQKSDRARCWGCGVPFVTEP